MTSVSSRYVITAILHEGASTRLYRGYRTSDAAPVVIKQLKGDYPSLRDIARLRHEHAILSRLDVPGVVRAHGLEKTGASLALVMEELRGQPLHEILRARRLDLRTALSIAASLAGTLESLHRRDVIHRDIKPHNVVVSLERDEVKLTDFGVATLLSQEGQKARSPDLLEGTLAYMSPEQTGRMNRLIDHRTDLYSLGVTLYEMLTGSLPFRAADPMELVHSHIARIAAPPHQIAPDVPEAVSAIVMKLLAKAAEDRYQRAQGLRADLLECLAQLDATGRIEPFPLGRRDGGGALRMPQRLYGREAETAALLSSFERARGGAAEILLVSGYAGVGKSALVNEIHKAIAHRGGSFAAGKFDQLPTGKPCAPVAGAFRELLQDLLAGAPEALARAAAELRHALGPNGQLLVDLLPELERVIGPQPAVADLGSTEAQNRFAGVFEAFLRVFAAPERPLVLFLDDLHWADPASLRLLQTLITRADLGNLLLIGAYRDNEVGASHPLALALAEIRKAGVHAREISLQPLDADTVRRLVADALGSSEPHADPLSALVFERTHGNPFFVSQLLSSLSAERLVWFDEGAGAWQWDLPKIRGRGIADDVVAFMADRIRALSPDARRLTTLASCIGYRFDLRTLALVSERPPDEAAAELWEALREGIILPIDPEYRLVHAEREPGGESPMSDPGFRVSYRFLHDRVQQAAYSLIEDAQKREVHLRIGRLLRGGPGRAPREDELFEIVRHMNTGAALLTDPSERLDLARLNLAAGRRARAGTAYEAAAGLMAEGASLLGEGGWEREPDLAFALHAGWAECAFLAGSFDKAEALFDLLLAHARSRLDQAHVHELRMVLTMTLGRTAEAVQIGLAGVALFGIEVPSSPADRQAAVAAELALVPVNLAGRSIEDLAFAPALTDPEHCALLKLLVTITPAAYFLDPLLLAFATVKQVNLSLQHGHSDLSAYGYMSYAVIVAGILGRYEEAHRFGKLALALDEKFKNPALTCQLNHIFQTHLYYLREPLRAGLEAYFPKAYQAGLESGDLLYLSYCTFFPVQARLDMGDDLAALSEDVERYLALVQRTKNAICTAWHTISRQRIASLTGRTRSLSHLGDTDEDDAALAASFDAPELAAAACYLASARTELRFLDENLEGALAASIDGERLLDSAVCQYFAITLSFYTCLTLAGLEAAGARCTDGERAQRAARLDAHRGKLARWAESCPENFRHKLLLVDAERARAGGRDLEAMELYDQAIAWAARHGFVRDEALGSELCAKFYSSRGREKCARIYMTDAYHGHARWGASAKAEHLAARYRHLVLESGAPLAVTTTTTTGRGGGAGLFDMPAVLLAAQAIAGELDLARLLRRVLPIVLKNAGAQRGFLLLEREDGLQVEASMTVDPEVVRVGPPVPLEAAAADLAASVVRHVAGTGEPLVLGDAASAPRFGADPHIAAARPRSILCVALAHQGRRTGVLYLENNAAPDVFTPARLEICKLLASQAAVAVENALLLARVQAMTGELRRSNEELEAEVSRRTAELCAANERLAAELAERARLEEARAALQQDILRAHQERLAELSTPLIPITDRVMVMPLIGTVDAERAEQALAAVLEGAQANRAGVVILDITGVRGVDARVAATLGRMARALRLLGAQAVITGIRPEVARAMIELGVDLGAVVTRSTLRSGIAYALSRSGGGFGA